MMAGRLSLRMCECCDYDTWTTNMIPEHSDWIEIEFRVAFDLVLCSGDSVPARDR
jgi:hypothetical protein